ncbi:MAG: LCP family protein [Acidobacteriota bacterium]|nr:LCP family protein [Acidobacteriota bacterium]
MSEPPGNRQDDLDWLYGREPDARPQPTRANEPDTDRPRVSTPAYEVNPPKPVAQQRPPRASRPPQHPPQPERPMAPTPGSQVRRQHRTPRWRRGLRMSVLALVAWLIFLVATPVYALGRMAEVDQSGSSERPPRQPGTATLLVGTDARDPGPGYQPVPGDEDLTSVRADTIMLLYRPPTGRSVLVSLPRDSYVPIPGFGQDKLNAAYAYGGPALLAETVELVTGVRLDGYLEIGFDGFASLVNAVGGVEVCTDIALQDDFSGLDLPAGCSTLDGTQALAYVRMRYADPRGDIGRAERQREVIGKVVNQAASPISVLNPFRYWNLNMAGARMLTRGNETGVFDLLGAARALVGVASGDGLSLVVPIADPAGISDTGASVVIWDRENALALFDEIGRGDTSQLDRFLS